MTHIWRSEYEGKERNLLFAVFSPQVDAVVIIHASLMRLVFVLSRSFTKFVFAFFFSDIWKSGSSIYVDDFTINCVPREGKQQETSSSHFYLHTNFSNLCRVSSSVASRTIRESFGKFDEVSPAFGQRPLTYGRAMEFRVLTSTWKCRRSRDQPALACIL